MDRIRHERGAKEGVAAIAEETLDLKVDFTHGRAPGRGGRGGPGA
jgi:hypothetical protein